jgi:hypothetical protein
MRVWLRFKMPRESILKGEGDYDPATGEVVFCAHTVSELDRRLSKSKSGPLHILEVIAVIEGKEFPLQAKDDRWFAHTYDFRGKLQPLRWQVPPPPPRWEIPFLRDKPVILAQLKAMKPRPVIKFKGILDIWNAIKQSLS